MRAPLPRPRFPAARRLAAAALLVCASASASGQSTSPRSAVQPAQGPTIPTETSRPRDWPTATPPAADNHVLSSIRTNPGAPLEPIDPRLTADVTHAVATGSAAPGGVALASFESPAPAAAGQPAYQSLETALVVARVGPEVVLEADVLTPKAIEWLDKVSPGMPPEQVRQLRLQICQQVLPQHIETLLVYVDACREIPEDKLPEIRKNVDRAFDEQQLPRMMKEANSPNSMEYEKSLRARGTSLDRMRKMFFERGLSQEWLRRNAKSDDEIPHAEMIAWYQAHIADYEYPARARYEILTVRMGLKRSRREAWDMLATMGNEVLAGRPFDEVAKARSEGPTASAGGTCDWTSRGSLASKVLDEALFSLPPGQLSSILEDGETLHIVRVLERQEPGRTPFLEAQVGIRETLREERRKRAQSEYLAKLRERTPVWTVFDAEAAGTPLAADRPAGTGPVR